METCCCLVSVTLPASVNSGCMNRMYQPRSGSWARNSAGCCPAEGRGGAAASVSWRAPPRAGRARSRRRRARAHEPAPAQPEAPSLGSSGSPPPCAPRTRRPRPSRGGAANPAANQRARAEAAATSSSSGPRAPGDLAAGRGRALAEPRLLQPELGRRSRKEHDCQPGQKGTLWSGQSADWPDVRLASRAFSVGPAAPGSEMSKPPPKPVKPGQVRVFRALYTFEPRTPDELYFEEGDIIYITDMSDTNWWKGTCKGRTGLIPSNYVAEQAESIDNPLHEAAKRGNLSWLRECLDNHVGVNGLDKAGSTALYWACHGGHKDIVEMLFTQPNVELNQQNKLGDTALHAAAWKGYADIVQLLLTKGARTDLRNNEKKLALDMATNAACASLLKKKQGTDAVRTLSNAEDYLDDEDSD
ncbi:osteoclast-stimulating factor 1 [Tenrec ecaudatus]|uniref:osteoclast-stimulating factor 1 n=1 Tax=Tenrec ecaudatus TaxID=94439 RepID=UPI003F5A7860